MDEFGNNLPYLLTPRSSTVSKTPLRMSNSLGLIDAGYRRARFRQYAPDKSVEPKEPERL